MRLTRTEPGVSVPAVYTCRPPSLMPAAGPPGEWDSNI